MRPTHSGHALVSLQSRTEDDRDFREAVPRDTPRPWPWEENAQLRRYLREIARTPRLTAAPVVSIGHRIEAPEVTLRRAPACLPVAVRRLVEIGDKAQHVRVR
jgi:hypothetical protein